MLKVGGNKLQHIVTLCNLRMLGMALKQLIRDTVCTSYVEHWRATCRCIDRYGEDRRGCRCCMVLQWWMQSQGSPGEEAAQCQEDRAAEGVGSDAADGDDGDVRLLPRPVSVNYGERTGNAAQCYSMLQLHCHIGLKMSMVDMGKSCYRGGSQDLSFVRDVVGLFAFLKVQQRITQRQGCGC